MLLGKRNQNEAAYTRQGSYAHMLETSLPFVQKKGSPLSAVQ